MLKFLLMTAIFVNFSIFAIFLFLCEFSNISVISVYLSLLRVRSTRIYEHGIHYIYNVHVLLLVLINARQRFWKVPHRIESKVCFGEKSSKKMIQKKSHLFYIILHLLFTFRRHLWPALSVLLPLLLFLCPWDNMTAVCYGVKRNGFKQRWGLLKEVGYVLISPFSKVGKQSYIFSVLSFINSFYSFS